VNGMTRGQSTDKGTLTRDSKLQTENCRQEATCIGCGCSDRHACVAPVTGACFWIKVDRELGIGVCSECPERVDLFEAWQNHAHHGEPTRRRGDAETRGEGQA